MYDLHAILAQLRDKNSPLFAAQREMLHCLYHKLEALQDRGDPLFSMWQSELTLTYGDLDAILSRNTKIRRQELCALYGFEAAEEVSLTRLLKCLQTFYSVLIKLIAYNMVRAAASREDGDGDTMESILSGQAFASLGICNYCYDDWFSWLLKYRDPAIETHFGRLRACLEAVNTVPSVEAFLQTFPPDSFKSIYETVLPKEIRHALGEYYTPGWLADRAIKDAAAAGGKNMGDLRFLDPTCGAGTFLTRVLHLRRAEPAQPAGVAGFDINALAVLTAKANYLAAVLDRIGSRPGFVIPIYHYDIINMPLQKGNVLVIDTNCGLICELPYSICESAAREQPSFCADSLLQLIDRREDCRELRHRLAGYDLTNRRILANILLNRIFAFFSEKADVVVGNPPWVNWEYLPQKYKEKSRHLWPEYGLLRARGRELSFLKEDISVLVTCIVIDRFLREKGLLCFVLRQAMFKSAQNGAGFRRFRLEKGDIPFRVLQVEDLGNVNPFEGAQSRSALVLIRKGERHTFPVPYSCWTRRKFFLRASRAPDATAESVMAFVDVEKTVAYPADKNDPASPWINAPAALAPVIDAVLGSNPYKARTGVFTGGANAVYYLDIMGKRGENVTVRNRVDRAKRKVRAVTAELEPDFVYPLVRGSEISRWSVRSESYILCPHTAQTRIYPVAEDVLRTAAPETMHYLTAFRAELEARKGFAGWERAIQSRHFYAISRVGEYTFSKYKVAWRYIARSFITAVIAPARDDFLGEKLYIPNEKVMFVGTDCEAEAYYLCGVLSSSPVSYCVACYMNPTSISAHVLDKLHIPRYDPSDTFHREIAALCRAGHRAETPEERAALQAQLDERAGAMYGLSDATVQEIRAALNKY